MTLQFDGKKIANELRISLKKDVQELRAKKITPKLVSLLVGEDAESKKYLSLKKAAAEDIGVVLEIRDYPEDISVQELIDDIEDFNLDKKVNGIMLQLPLPEGFSNEERDQIISLIDSKKDVDGMKKESVFVAPVVKAVLTAMKMATLEKKISEDTLIVVLGSEGFVGQKILKTLEEMGYRVKGVDAKIGEDFSKVKKAEIVITATGEKNLVTESMVEEGVILIDVGAPDAEISKDAYEKSFFYTPVPGGIGPLTIEFLLENLLISANNQA